MNHKWPQIMPLLRKHPEGMSVRMLSEEIGMTTGCTRDALHRHEDQGQVRYVGDHRLVGRWCAVEHIEHATRAYWADYGARVDDVRRFGLEKQRLRRRSKEPIGIGRDLAPKVEPRIVPPGSNEPLPFNTTAVRCVWEWAR